MLRGLGLMYRNIYVLIIYLRGFYFQTLFNVWMQYREYVARVFNYLFRRQHHTSSRSSSALGLIESMNETCVTSAFHLIKSTTMYWDRIAPTNAFVCPLHNQFQWVVIVLCCGFAFDREYVVYAHQRICLPDCTDIIHNVSPGRAGPANVDIHLCALII